MVTQNDSNSLLVPIFLDAYVVDTSTQQEFAIYNADYGNLANYTDLLPLPGTASSGSKPAPGIYLHWALPDALTHGQKNADGAIVFPYVPNRWVVIRYTPGANLAGSMTAWVVQSDYNNAQTGTNAFLDPANPPTIDGSGSITVNGTLVGTSYTVQAWQAQGDPGTSDFFLQAIAPGNISFAAYQPFCNNVFAFTDSSLAETATGNYSYLVTGWYSDPTKDPLANATAAEFESILQGLMWSLPQGTSVPATPPTTSLYHGFAADVQWPLLAPTNPNIPNPADPNNPVQVAVGNTATDALAALIQNYAMVQGKSDSANQQAWITAGNTLCSLIQAAMLQLLDDYGVPGGNALVKQQVEKSWFGADPGGTIWTVASVTAQDAAFDLSGDGLTAAQNAALVSQLATLNAQQQTYDAQQRKLLSLQSQLYMTWLDVMQSTSKYNAFGETPTTTPDWSILQPALQNTLYPNIYNEVWKLCCAQTSALAALPDPSNITSATTWANTNWTFPATSGTGTATLSSLKLVLKGTAAPAFQHPVDPVVLVCGGGMVNKHGQDGAYNADGTLTVRLGAQTITGLAATGEPAVNASSFAASLLDQLTSFTAIPGLTNLLTEVFFCDPLNAPLMATTVSGTTAAALQTCITNLLDENTSTGAWTGTAPSPIGYRLWSQAWSPLWLEWIVNYYPTVDTSGDFDMTSWDFNGKNYHWNGNGVAASPYLVQLNGGRTVSTPYAQTVLQTALKKYLGNNPAIDNTQLESLLGTVMSWDILAQSLTGLTDQLITRLIQTGINPPVSGNPVPCPLPTKPSPTTGPPVGDLVQDQYNYMPLLESGTGNVFFPMRGGLVTFASLNLVDAFGQTCDLQAANTGNGFQPLISPDLTPPAALVTPTQLNAPFMLSPRLVQSARLNMNFMANDGSGNRITSQNNNPICGWLLPNHLDKSIAVYDGTGNLLGELLQLPAPANWRPRPGAPGTNPPPATPQDISNATLSSVVTQLAAQTQDVLGDFMQVIDETMWMSDPLGGQSNTFMSALIGRPLAVVMMDVNLELNGQPATNQLFDEMLDPSSTSSNPIPVEDTGNVENIPLPVSLGSIELRNDGLMGYFLTSTTNGTNAYTNFYAVHPAPVLSAGDTFIQPIVNASTTPKTYNGNLTLQADGSSVTVTLILDPLGVVHGYSGILPVASAALPGSIVQDFLKTLQVNVQTGPILADQGTLRTPQPATKQGTWNWLQNVSGTWSQNTIVDADDDARFPLQPPALREGWLQLGDIGDAD